MTDNVQSGDESDARGNDGRTGTDRLSGRLGAASRRDILKATAGASAAAVGIGSGVIGSASAQVIPTPPLHVDGNLVKDPDGQTVKLRGVNMVDPKRANVTAPARGKNAVQIVDKLTDTSQDWHSRAIRIPVQPVDIGEHQPGEGPEPVAFSQEELDEYLSTHLDPVVDRCLDRGAYAIVDFHRHRRVQWTNETLAEEVEMFWETVAPRYADDPHVIYELYNEPTEPGMWADPQNPEPRADEARQNWRLWKETAQPWVDTIRANAPDNLVLIGSPGWTQSPEGALLEPFDGGNLAYTYHIYPTHNVSQESCHCWDDASNNGEGVNEVYEEYPLFVTEFGWAETAGRVTNGTDTFGAAFLDWLEQSPGIHWTAWVADPVWQPVMFERAFTDGSYTDNIGNPYEESVPAECSNTPCEWSLLTGDGFMGDDIKQTLSDTRNDLAPTVSYDDQTPSAPANVGTSNVSETSVDISWSSVSDPGEAGMSHYNVHVDDERIEGVDAGSTSTTIDGLQADSTVTVGVTAVDRARNESPAATTQVTTDAFDDGSAPSQPTGLNLPAKSHQSITVDWEGSSDQGGGDTAGMSHYNVYLDGSIAREVPADTARAQLTDLEADTTYEIGVSAVDLAGNESPAATEEVTTDLASAGGEDLLVNDFDGDPSWPGENELGNWCGAGGFESIGVENGALRIEYANEGWYGTQIAQDVSDTPTLKLHVTGQSGGEEQAIEFQLGDVSSTLGDVATGSVTTSGSILAVDLEDAGADPTSPGQLQLKFYGAGDGTIEIHELWLDDNGAGAGTGDGSSGSGTGDGSSGSETGGGSGGSGTGDGSGGSGTGGGSSGSGTGDGSGGSGTGGGSSGSGTGDGSSGSGTGGGSESEEVCNPESGSDTGSESGSGSNWWGSGSSSDSNSGSGSFLDQLFGSDGSSDSGGGWW